MLQLLEAQYITLTQSTYPGCFGNVQSIYRSLELSERYRPHAERNKCSQKIVSTKTGLVKCIAKSAIAANFHTWIFGLERLQRMKKLSSPKAPLFSHVNQSGVISPETCEILPPRVFFNFCAKNYTLYIQEWREYKTINHHFWYCFELIIYLYWCNIYCIPTSPWFIPPDTTHRFIKISKQHIENRMCQKQNSLQ